MSFDKIQYLFMLKTLRKFLNLMNFLPCKVPYQWHLREVYKLISYLIV